LKRSTYGPEGLTGSTAKENGRNGAKENLKIQKEGPLVYVFEIELDPIRKIVHVVST
jgi:hypothetical protein